LAGLKGGEEPSSRCLWQKAVVGKSTTHRQTLLWAMAKRVLAWGSSMLTFWAKPRHDDGFFAEGTRGRRFAKDKFFFTPPMGLWRSSDVDGLS